MGGVAMQIANKKNSLKVYATKFGTRPDATPLSYAHRNPIQPKPKLQLVLTKRKEEGNFRWLHLFFFSGKWAGFCFRVLCNSSKSKFMV